MIITMPRGISRDADTGQTQEVIYAGARFPAAGVNETLMGFSKDRNERFIEEKKYAGYFKGTVA